MNLIAIFMNVIEYFVKIQYFTKRVNFLAINFLFALHLFSQNPSETISGQVSSERKPLSDVNILVKGSTKGTKTDEKGKFRITARPKEILVFTYLGMNPVEIVVVDSNSELDVILEPKVEELSGVTVKMRKHQSQKELLADYPTNKGLIKTSLGIINKDRSSYSMRIVDGGSLIPVGTDFLYSLQNFIPLMEVVRFDASGAYDPKVYLPGGIRPPPPAIFDVDGFVYDTAPSFISVSNIDRIAILTRNGAISRYGPRAAGGVIIINTKEQARVDDLGVHRIYDKASFRDSIRKVLNSNEAFVSEIPDYMHIFYASNSETEALNLFEKQRDDHEDLPYFFIDVSDYFSKTWGNIEESKRILQIVEDQFPHDYSALRTVAFKYEEIGKFKNALNVYLTILKIRSKDAQSHRDVANAYAENGNYQEALIKYMRYEIAVSQLDTIPFDEYGNDFLMRTESSNIIRSKGKEFLSTYDTRHQAEGNLNIRIVFEWSHPQAQFDIQVVNPEKNYDTWSYVPVIDKGQISIEGLRGYLSQQFFLDNIIGLWEVNLNYYGNKNETPTYLKVTAYFDYGLSTQSKQLKVLKLWNTFQNKRICSIDSENNSMLD